MPNNALRRFRGSSRAPRPAWGPPLAASSSSPGRCRPVAGREEARRCRRWGARPRSASLPRDPGPSLRRGGLAPPPPPGPLAPEAAALPCPDRRRGPGFPGRNKLYLRLWVAFLIILYFFFPLGCQRRPPLGRREVSAMSCDWGERFSFFFLEKLRAKADKTSVLTALNKVLFNRQ